MLAVGSAFAAISGKFTGTYEFHFDGKPDGYKKANPDFGLTLFADTKKATYEGGVYAKLAASAQFGTYTSTPELSSGIGYNWTIKKDLPKNVFSLSVTEASINGADWSFDFIADVAAKDYAKSTIDSEKDENGNDVAYDFDATDLTKNNAVKFTKDGFSVAATANFNPTDKKMIVVSAETKELVSEDIKVQFATAFKTEASDKTVVGNLKGSFFEVATAAADFVLYSRELYSADFAFTYKFAPFTFDTYYATYAESRNADDKVFGKKTNLLSAKLLTDLTKYVPVKFSFAAKDVLNSKTLDVEVETNAIVNTVLKVYGKNLLTVNQFGAEAVYTGIENAELKLNASYGFITKAVAVNFDAKYTADLYTATFSADLFGQTTVSAFALNAGISSETLISGAKLSLDYETKNNFLKTGENEEKMKNEKVSVSCEVTF